MKKNNKSRYAVLGMLLQKPQSGYEIRQFMINSTDYFWQESDASIYPMLKILETEGKVTAQSEFVGKRERKIFEITQTGKDEFLAWMTKPAEKENSRNELLLKFFLGASVPKEEVVKQLFLRKQNLQETKKKYKSIEADVLSKVANEYPHKFFWLMALQYGVVHADTELRWLDECIEKLEKK